MTTCGDDTPVEDQIVTECVHGTIFGGTLFDLRPRTRLRLGAFVSQRKGEPADVERFSPFFVTYSLKPSSPARQAFEKRMTAKALARDQARAARVHHSQREASAGS